MTTCLKLRQTCPKCGQLRSPTSFRRRLTRRQAQARGYDLPLLEALDRWPTIPSTLCRQCQPNRHYKPSQMSIKQIEEAIYNGVVREQTAAPMIEKKKRIAKREQREAVVRRWYVARTAHWDTMSHLLAKELERVQHRYRLTQDKFLALYIEECKRLRGVLTLKAREGDQCRGPDQKPIPIQTLVAPHLTYAWWALEEEQRRRFNARKPLLLFSTSA